MPSTRVLLVDDVADFRKLVSIALRRRGGFEVVGQAANGEEAVALAAQLRPDVVVLDLGLPDLAGTDVITELRTRVPSKIVVFTGRDVDGDAMRRVEGVVRKDEDVALLVDVLVAVTTTSDRAGVSLRLRKELSSAGLAREFVAKHCLAWGYDSIAEDALLVVSELVTNAIVHAHSEPELRLIPTAGGLRIEVADDGAATPDPQLARDGDEHGRGLLLIAVLSAAWGTDPSPDGGKVVWADMPIAN